MPAPGAVSSESTARFGVHRRHGENGHEPSDELRNPVRDYLLRGKLSRHGEPEGHGGVEVAAGDVSERRDRKREAQPERERDPEAADCPGPDVHRNGDRVEAEEEEEKRAQCLRGEAQTER